MDPGEQDRIEKIVTDAIYAEFTIMSEKLFAKDAAFHSTERRWQDELRQMKRQSPSEVFICLPYPEELDGVPTRELWETVLGPDSARGLLNRSGQRSSWESVGALRHYLAECRRDLLWKSQLATEIERLALHSLTGRAEPQPPESAAVPADSNGCTTEHGLEAARAGDEDAVGASPMEPQLSLIDRIIAMLLDRSVLPPDSDEAEFYESLAEQHARLRQLWVRDFGFLPYSVK